MNAIEKATLEAVTSDDDRQPQKEQIELLCKATATSSSDAVREMAQWLAKRAVVDSVPVRIKALRIMFQMTTNGSPAFRAHIKQAAEATVKELAAYVGVPHPRYGDSANQMIRNSAQKTLTLLASVSTALPEAKKAPGGLAGRIAAKAELAKLALAAASTAAQETAAQMQVAAADKIAQPAAVAVAANVAGAAESCDAAARARVPAAPARAAPAPAAGVDPAAAAELGRVVAACNAEVSRVRAEWQTERVAWKETTDAIQATLQTLVSQVSVLKNATPALAHSPAASAAADGGALSKLSSLEALASTNASAVQTLKEALATSSREAQERADALSAAAMEQSAELRKSIENVAEQVSGAAATANTASVSASEVSNALALLEKTTAGQLAGVEEQVAAVVSMASSSGEENREALGKLTTETSQTSAALEAVRAAQVPVAASDGEAADGAAVAQAVRQEATAIESRLSAESAAVAESVQKLEAGLAAASKAAAASQAELAGLIEQKAGAHVEEAMATLQQSVADLNSKAEAAVSPEAFAKIEQTVPVLKQRQVQLAQAVQQQSATLQTVQSETGTFRVTTDELTQTQNQSFQTLNQRVDSLHSAMVAQADSEYGPQALAARITELSSAAQSHVDSLTTVKRDLDSHRTETRSDVQSTKAETHARMESMAEQQSRGLAKLHDAHSQQKNVLASLDGAVAMHRGELERIKNGVSSLSQQASQSVVADTIEEKLGRQLLDMSNHITALRTATEQSFEQVKGVTSAQIAELRASGGNVAGRVDACREELTASVASLKTEQDVFARGLWAKQQEELMSLAGDQLEQDHQMAQLEGHLATSMEQTKRSIARLEEQNVETVVQELNRRQQESEELEQRHKQEIGELTVTVGQLGTEFESSVSELRAEIRNGVEDELRQGLTSEREQRQEAMAEQTERIAQADQRLGALAKQQDATETQVTEKLESVRHDSQQKLQSFVEMLNRRQQEGEALEQKHQRETEHLQSLAADSTQRLALLEQSGKELQALTTAHAKFDGRITDLKAVVESDAADAQREQQDTRSALEKTGQRFDMRQREVESLAKRVVGTSESNIGNVVAESNLSCLGDMTRSLGKRTIKLQGTVDRFQLKLDQLKESQNGVLQLMAGGGVTAFGGQ